MAKNKAKKNNSNRSIKTGLIILWGTFSVIMLTMVGAVYAISKGWLGNLPEITELENPVNKFASRLLICMPTSSLIVYKLMKMTSPLK